MNILGCSLALMLFLNLFENLDDVLRLKICHKHVNSVRYLVREYLIITKSWPLPQQPRPTPPPPPLCNNLIPSRYLGEQRDAWIFFQDTRYFLFQHFKFCSVCYHFNIIENITKPPFKFVIGSSTTRKKIYTGSTLSAAFGQSTLGGKDTYTYSESYAS